MSFTSLDGNPHMQPVRERARFEAEEAGRDFEQEAAKWLDVVNGFGFPYGEFDAVQWPQAAADIAAIVQGQFVALSEDELVVHLRSGDIVNEINTWLTKDAPNPNFNENADIKPPMLPACAYYLDAFKNGFNGGPFTKVHLITDTDCTNEIEAPDLANLPGVDQGSYDAVQDVKHPDRARKEGEPPDCWTTNPCMKVLYEHIPEGVLVGPPANASFPQLFKRDTRLMARAQNIAAACSTFSLLGRLTAAHLKRLFVPQCQTKYALSEKQQKEGRRRDTRAHLVVDGRFYWFHQGYAWLPLGIIPAAGQPFSIDEPRQVSFYENIFEGHPVLVTTIGGDVVALEEWSKLTRNGTNQRPLDSLLRQVAVNKTTFNQGEHAWEVIPAAGVQQPAAPVRPIADALG